MNGSLHVRRKVRTDDYPRDVADHLAKSWVRHVLDEETKDGFQQHVVPTPECYSETITMYELLDQRKRRCGWNLLKISSTKEQTLEETDLPS